MSRMSAKTALVVATVVVAVAAGASGASPLVTVKTPALVAEPGGYLNCTVKAKGTSPIGIVATILRRDGIDVTAFGTGFRASPDATGDGFYHAEETAGAVGSSADEACFCKAIVTGAWMKDVHVTLEARAP